MSGKSNFYSQKSEEDLKELNSYNPELSLAIMMRGIGYALLAVFEVLQEIRNGNNNK